MAKEDIDLRELQMCVHCGKGMMHAGAIYFYEVTVTQCITDMNSVRQMAGLELTLGAAAPLASIFAPSTRVAVRMGDGVKKFVCSECALTKEVSLYDYMEDEA